MQSRKIMLILFIAALTVIASGCGMNKPNFIFRDVKITRDPYISSFAEATGTFKNTGGKASYVEYAIKLKDANGVVVSTGWANDLNVGAGEERRFSIQIFDYTSAWTTWEIVWSTKPFSVMQ